MTGFLMLFERYSALIDDFAVVGIQRHFTRPSLRENALEMRADDALVSLFKIGMEIEDGLSRALHEALGLAMADRHVAADQVVRQLDDHANPAQAAALYKA